MRFSRYMFIWLFYQPSKTKSFFNLRSLIKLFFNSGSHLLFRAVSSKVPSAAWVLTIVFGMGTGVTPRRIATGKIRYPVVSAQSDGGDRWKLASVRSYAADCISGSAATE